jgi:hypothetical protein
MAALHFIRVVTPRANHVFGAREHMLLRELTPQKLGELTLVVPEYAAQTDQGTLTPQTLRYYGYLSMRAAFDDPQGHSAGTRAFNALLVAHAHEPLVFFMRTTPAFGKAVERAMDAAQRLTALGHHPIVVFSGSHAVRVLWLDGSFLLPVTDAAGDVVRAHFGIHGLTALVDDWAIYDANEGLRPDAQADAHSGFAPRRLACTGEWRTQHFLHTTCDDALTSTLTAFWREGVPALV